MLYNFNTYHIFNAYDCKFTNSKVFNICLGLYAMFDVYQYIPMWLVLLPNIVSIYSELLIY